MPIVIPPRGSKPGSKTTEKKVPVLPPRTGIAAIVHEQKKVDSAAFNKSVLPQRRGGGESGEPPRIIMPLHEAKLTGITTTIKELLEQYPLPTRPDGKPIIPFDWQQEDFNTLIQWDRIGMFLPVGSGKTLMLTLLMLAWGLQYNVVILPPILIRQWVKWINGIKNAGGAAAYKGVPKKRAEIDLLKYRWWIMSYGIFKNDFNKLMKLLSHRKYALAVDEAQNIKNSQSQLHQLVARFSAGQSLALATGTELNDPADAYGYVKLKTPGVYRSYGHFKNVHVGAVDFFDNPVKWINIELMHDNLYLQSVRRTKEEVHSHLEDANYQQFTYELHERHMKLYRELGEQQLLELENGGKIDATTQQNLYHHMQQVVTNPAKYGLEDVRPAWMDVIDNLIEQLDFGSPTGPKKFIVWTWYQETTELVKAYLESLYPGRVAIAYGKSNSDKEFARFEEDPDCWWIVGQPLSVGAGVNPQYVCYNMVWIETPTRSIPFRQGSGRIDREGKIAAGNIWIATAENTIQQMLFDNLLANDELVSKVQKDPLDIRKMLYGGDT